MKTKYTAEDISEWFIWYSDQMNAIYDEDTISNLKLQKLLYYAQGCYLAISEKALFDNKIVAWDHGPVVESVYHIYKEYGNCGIELKKEEPKINFKSDKEMHEFLAKIYSIFGKYSAWGLRNKTHEEAPWKETKRNEVISLDLIKSFFKKEYIEN